MKKKFLSLGVVGILAASMALTSCDKDDDNNLAPVETYLLKGRIDATRSTITTAALTNAQFTISYNNANSFGDAQSILNGNYSFTGYTGVATGADTLSFFATQATGPAISYLTIATTALNTTSTTGVYVYKNGTTNELTINKFPFTNDITAALKEGRGYFRIGKSPKYVYILLDNVTKQ